MIKRIDNKHSITSDGVIIKTSNGVPIPEHEPRILFRGRDRLALPMLYHYRNLCIQDGATDYQLETLNGMIEEFEKFRIMFPTVMKQPGSSKGK